MVIGNRVIDPAFYNKMFPIVYISIFIIFLLIDLKLIVHFVRKKKYKALLFELFDVFGGLLLYFIIC